MDAQIILVNRPAADGRNLKIAYDHAANEFITYLNDDRVASGELWFGPVKGQQGNKWVVCSKVLLKDHEGRELDAFLKARIRERSQAARAELEKNIPGLTQLEEAYWDEERYHDQFAKMMDDEYNDGARPPKAVKIHADELAPKFPRAALYLKAQSYSRAGHHVKATSGLKAMGIIANGGSLEDAATVLDNWLKDTYVD